MTAKQASRQNQDVRPSRQPFFPFYADDWIAGTLNLTFEQRGFYIAVLAAIWSRKAAIPVDQIPMAVVCDKRVAARLLPQLIDLGKLNLDAANRVYNTRLNRLLQVTPDAETSDELPADFPETSAELPAEVPEKSGNIFPENPTKSTPPRARDRAISIAISKKEDREQQPASNLSGAARETEIAGLNGATREIVGGLAGWLNSDWEKARGIVEAQVKLHSAEAVKIGYGELVAKAMADDLLVDNPANAFPAFVREAAKRMPKPFDYQAALARKARVEARLADLRRN